MDLIERMPDLRGCFFLTPAGSIGRYEDSGFRANADFTRALARPIAAFIDAYRRTGDTAGHRIAIVHIDHTGRPWQSHTLAFEDAALRQRFPMPGPRDGGVTAFQQRNREKSLYRGMELLLDHHHGAIEELPYYCPVLVYRNTRLDGYLAMLGRTARVSDRVGRAGLAELLDALEERYGSAPSEAASTAPARDPYDVPVVGGGPAGASAAIYSARKGLRTGLVAKEMGGQLTQTVGIENLIGTVHTEGMKLASDLLAHVRSYPVEVLDNRRVETIENGEMKTVRLAGGETLTAKALIVATGAQWLELNVPGEKQYIGRGVAFCPHCDGPFYKDRDVVVTYRGCLRSRTKTS